MTDVIYHFITNYKMTRLTHPFLFVYFIFIYNDKVLLNVKYLHISIIKLRGSVKLSYKI